MPLQLSHGVLVIYLCIHQSMDLPSIRDWVEAPEEKLHTREPTGTQELRYSGAQVLRCPGAQVLKERIGVKQIRQYLIK